MVEIIFKELSYRINGILFSTHNALGRFCREKQYSDVIENFLKEAKIEYVREKALPLPKIDYQFTNRVDFDISNKVLLEIKAKPLIGREDYAQINRYLDASGYKLGIIVNFRNKYLKPIRVIRSHS